MNSSSTSRTASSTAISTHSSLAISNVRPLLFEDVTIRIPYVLVMPKYQPIITLTSNWEEFMVAFIALFYCHAMLWSVNIRHGNISGSNLMWDPEEKKAKLCDFDLSHFCEPLQIGVPEKGPDGPMGLSATGTWIFMADELLTGEAMEGSVKRVYRHEVEAFVAVLVWIACRYEDGEVRPGRPLEHWSEGSYLLVKDNRARTFNAITTPKAFHKPSGLPRSVWRRVKNTVNKMGQHQDQLGLVRRSLTNFALDLDDSDSDESTPELSEDFDDSDSEESLPTEVPEDFDDLRALRKKILSWDIFKLSSAKLFVNLMKERILNPNKQQETET